MTAVPPSKPVVLLVDDEHDRLHLVPISLGDGYRVLAFDNARDALGQTDLGTVDVILSDVRMAGMNGLELLDAVRVTDPDLAVVLLTSYGSVSQAVACIKRGAYDYLQAGFEDEALRATTHRAVEHTRLARRARNLEARLHLRESYNGIVGQSRSMHEVFSLIDRVSTSDITVLVTGESGTGKELVARVVHRTSRRSSGRFVPINCAAIPRELLESELFGHTRGAFSGAHESKPGLIEVAAGGTLFLDEVSELPSDLQVKLNRFLQDGEVRRVGAIDGNRLDVRIIAATNTELEREVEAGRFRRDVFYRLNEFPIHLPPLRQRPEDIPLLAQVFLEARCEREAKSIEGFDPEVLAALCSYDWPGNVRELEAVVARAVVMARTSRIGQECLSPALRRTTQLPASARAFDGLSYREARAAVEAEGVGAYLRQLISRHAGDVRQAAKTAQVERETLYGLLKRHGIRPASYRRSGNAA
ncbi:MAG: sigma-54-dependent Fis family transcriptional regulator [Candidatus Wallbacteria bacterium]|nr:sigma-54-dependent Fis family transcriptional regulator [Candidatus Wallbacteria bacterium]